jgi:hypothetical protein
MTDLNSLLVRVPEVVSVARDIARGLVPADWHRHLRPEVGDELCESVYLRPQQSLQEREWHASMLLHNNPSSSASTDPAYRLKVLEFAMLECVQKLNELTEDVWSREEVCSSRLRLRLASALHDEIRLLVREWDVEKLRSIAA